MGKKLKKTLIFELFASILVVALLAGLNALMGKSLAVDNELTLLSLDSRDVAVNSHRRHHGGRHGHGRRHHERSPNRGSDRHTATHQAQPSQPQATGTTQPVQSSGTPAATPAAPVSPQPPALQ